MKSKFYPSNKEHFIKLKKFLKIVLNLCRKSKINPIVYGGFMFFYYTQDKKSKVNDIDLYIKEKDFLKLIRVLKKSKLNYNYSPKWHTLQVSKGSLRIEFDSIDFWYTGPKETTSINFDGIIIKALNLKALKNVYKKASEKSQDNPEGNRKKYEILSRL